MKLSQLGTTPRRCQKVTMRVLATATFQARSAHAHEPNSQRHTPARQESSTRPPSPPPSPPPPPLHALAPVASTQREDRATAPRARPHGGDPPRTDAGGEAAGKRVDTPVRARVHLAPRARRPPARVHVRGARRRGQRGVSGTQRAAATTRAGHVAVSLVRPSAPAAAAGKGRRRAQSRDNRGRRRGRSPRRDADPIVDALRSRRGARYAA